MRATALGALLVVLESCASFGAEPPTSGGVAGADGGKDAGVADAPASEDAGTTCSSVASLAFDATGDVVRNIGSVAPGLDAQLRVHEGFPLIVDDIPRGPFAPGTGRAIDFGSTPITGEGVRSLDFPDPRVAEAAAGPAITITGWILLADDKSGPGGNRILSSVRHGGDEGIELVQIDRTLGVGVNDFSDRTGGPQSAPILEVSGTTVDAWRFFGVVYDTGTLTQPKKGQVVFYVGSPTTPAERNRSAEYDRGAIASSAASTLTLGNFPDGDARMHKADASRVPRAKLHALRVFPRALTSDEIRCEQTR